MRRARLPLLRLLRLALRLRSRPLQIGTGPLLVVAPHPDDETLGCGGLVLLHRRPGRPVSLVFLTDGAGSHSGHPTLTPARLAAQRRAEALEAATRLGVPAVAVHFLDLPDGELPRLSAETRSAAVTRLAALLDQLRPQTLLVVHRRDGSSEHEAAFTLAEAALSRATARPRVLEYPIWTAFSPRLLGRLLFTSHQVHRLAFPGLGSAKARALAAHVSQFAPTPPWTAPVQSLDFANAFSPEEEYFLELKP